MVLTANTMDSGLSIDMANTYWLTFRINDDAGADARRRALNNFIDNLSVRQNYKEPTSFIIFETKAEYSQILRGIDEIISENVDVVIVGAVNGRNVVLLGAAKHIGDLKAMIPNALPFRA